MSDQEASGPPAVEPPKNDFVLSEDTSPVKAPEPLADSVPKNTEHQNDNEDEADQQESTNGKPPKRGGFQKKIARLEAEIAAMRAGQQPKADVLAKADDAAPKGEPKPEEFTTYDDYSKAQARWTAEEVVKAHRQAEEIRSFQDAEQKRFKERVTAYEEGLTKARETYPDMDQALEVYEDVPVSPAIREALLASDNGGDLVYHLAKDADLFEKLNAIPVTNDQEMRAALIQVNRAFGRIEAKLELGSGNPAGNVVTVKTTNAPPPIKPVQKGKSAGNGFSEDMSPEDFAKWRRAQKTR